MVEGIEKNQLVPKSDEEKSIMKDLEELAKQLELRDKEVEKWKTDFEKIQREFSDRTQDIERLNSQLQKVMILKSKLHSEIIIASV